MWARWLMTGTNTGPFAGLPPTGRADQRARRRPGADPGRPRGRGTGVLRHGRGPAPARHAGGRPAQPGGAVPFGTSVWAWSGAGEPGAVSLTVLEASRPEADGGGARPQPERSSASLLEKPGFISSARGHRRRRGCTRSRPGRRPTPSPRLHRTAGHGGGDAPLSSGPEFAARGADRRLGPAPPERHVGALHRLRRDGAVLRRAAARPDTSCPRRPPTGSGRLDQRQGVGRRGRAGRAARRVRRAAPPPAKGSHAPRPTRSIVPTSHAHHVAQEARRPRQPAPARRRARTHCARRHRAVEEDVLGAGRA